MFQIIKFDDTLFGVKHSGGMFLGNHIKAGNFAIEKLDAEAIEVCQALAAFRIEGTNFADFGISGSLIFTAQRDVSEYLPVLPGRERGVA